jgi:hypothetical protein
MNIQVIAAASVETPPAGERTLFVNSDNGLLTWKYDDGTYHLFSEGDADCCACVISKDYADGILCALKSGILAPSDFNALIQLGFSVTATETTDPDTGDKVCTVTMGAPVAAVIAPVSLIIIPTVETFSHLSSQQYYTQFTPANTTNQAVNWFSSNPAVATVNSSGLVTGVAAGVTTIYAYSQANAAVFASKVITLS